MNGGVALINTIIFPTGTISTLTFPCKFPKKKGHEITFLNTMREDLMLNSFDDNIPIFLIFCNCFDSRLGFNCDNFHFCRQQDKDQQQESCGAFDQGVNCKLQPISLCLGEDSVCQQLTISFIPLAQLITWYDMRFLKRSIKAPPSALNTANKASVQSLLFLFLLS